MIMYLCFWKVILIGHVLIIKINPQYTAVSELFILFVLNHNNIVLEFLFVFVLFFGHMDLVILVELLFI